MENSISHTKTLRNGLAEEIFTIEEWVITTRRSHILNSKCSTTVVCDKTRHKYRNNNVTGGISPSVSPSSPNAPNIHGADHGTPRKTLEQLNKLKQELYHESQLCNFCKFDLILEMAHFPDMTYASNVLQLRHRPSGLVFEYNVMDSLMPVIVKAFGLPKGMKVSPSEAWLRARMDCEYTKNVMNADFDWTFSSDYRGSFRVAPQEAKDSRTVEDILLLDLNESSPQIAALIDQSSTERIDIEKLKLRNKIHFYDEIDLFEDELADHGVAQCNVKIRVMSDSFFVLLRFFLRVDNVFVRFFDTRLYHQFGKPYIVREFTNSEAAIPDLKLQNEEDAPHLLTNPAELYNHVPQKQLTVDKILLPREAIIKSS